MLDEKSDQHSSHLGRLAAALAQECLCGHVMCVFSVLVWTESCSETLGKTRVWTRIVFILKRHFKTKPVKLCCYFGIFAWILPTQI